MEKQFKQLIERVNILIKLQILTVLKDHNQTEKIIDLYALGISQSEISSLLNVPVNTITGTVSRIQRRRKKTKTKKVEEKIS